MSSSPVSTQSNTLLVAPLERFSRADLAIAGGKAANLGELVRAGFPVPPGFVLTTAAYDRFVAHNGLEAVIARSLAEEGHGGDAVPSGDAGPTGAAAELSGAAAEFSGPSAVLSGASIRRAFEAAPIPAEVEAEVLAAYRRLGEGPVAVRSSATAEDLPEAAFAGQQDTYLNITGAAALLDAVRRCWASLWTGRAIAYRERLGIDPQSVQLAVVVQKMAPAEAAGVMFTANPVSGARDEIVVEASPGLGEAIVSGLVTPEHLVIDRRSGEVKVRRPGRSEVIIRPRPEGGTEHIAGTAGDGRPTLPEGALQRLAQTGVAIERHFGSPQDVEWAWSGRELFILQARPITALPEPPPRHGRLKKMLFGVFSEMFPVRPYPLDQTAWLPALSAGALEPIFSLVGVDVPPVDQHFLVEDGVVIRHRGEIDARPTPRALLAPLRLLSLALRYDPRRYTADPLLPPARRRALELEARDLPAQTWQELVLTVREAQALIYTLAGDPRYRYFPRAILATGLLRVLLALLGRGDLFARLLSGVDSQTVQANRALEALAGRVRSDPALAAIFREHASGELLAALRSQPEAASFLAELQAFMDRFGHREQVLSTALQPTWKDAPEVVLGILQGFALTPPRPEPERADWEIAEQELLAHPLLRLSPLRLALLKLLATARYFWLVREDTHYDAARALPILRRTFLEMGRHLCALGVLEAPQDVFHLQFGELEGVGEPWPPAPERIEGLRAAVARRKKRRAELEGTPVVDPRLYRPPESGGNVLLSGVPGSPGVAAGPVRVIRDTAEFGKLRTGEVLVAPYTNPAWTPLFQRAAAVVVDGGAATSHAAIVAREYAIPAVMGTVTGTQTLHDGDWVEVDGFRGVVRPMEAGGNTHRESEGLSQRRAPE